QSRAWAAGMRAPRRLISSKWPERPCFVAELKHKQTMRADNFVAACPDAYKNVTRVRRVCWQSKRGLVPHSKIIPSKVLPKQRPVPVRSSRREPLAREL